MPHEAGQGAPPLARILAVVVLYGTSPSDARTILTLSAAFAANPALLDRVQVLVWDNSPEPQPAHNVSFPFAYRHASRNDGVSGAYNNAARIAGERGLGWLMLLDQDTAVTEPYLRGMVELTAQLDSRTEIAAVLPWLFAGRFQLSPRYVRFARHIPIPESRTGIETRELFAANSGVCLRVAALRRIGGYSTEFWLDYSDIYVFHRLFEEKLPVCLAPELRLEHEIAITDYDRRMTLARYRGYLAAEGAFHDLYKGQLERVAQGCRLLVRAVRQLRFRDPGFAELTRDAVLQRLFHRRAWRLARWREGRQR